MNKYVRRLFYFTDYGTERLSPLIYLFLIQTVAYGVVLAFFPTTGSLGVSALLFALRDISLTVATVWGWIALSIMVSNSVTFVFRLPWLSKLTALVGYLIWQYAFVAFILSGFWMSLFTIALPNLLFWVWYYFKTLQYVRVSAQELKIYDDRQLLLGKNGNTLRT